MATGNAITRMLGGTANVTLAGAAGPQNEIRQVRDVHSYILSQMPEEAPFFKLLKGGGLPAVPAGQFKFEQMIQHEVPHTVVVGTAVTADNPTIVLESGAYILPQTLLQDPVTHEQIFVTVVATNTLTVVRDFSDLDPVGSPPIPVGRQLQILSPIGEESQLAFRGVSRAIDAKYCYVGQMGWGGAYSEWASLVKYLGGSETERVGREAVRNFLRNVEAIHMFSRPNYDPTGGPNSKPVYSPGGLEYWCGQRNPIDMNGVLDYDSMGAALTPILNHVKSRNLVGVMGQGLLASMSRMNGFRGMQRSKSGSKIMGFEMTKIVFPQGGTMRFLPHQMMDEQGRERTMIVTNLHDVRRRYLGSKDFVLKKNVETRGRHATEIELSMISGLEHVNVLGAGILENVGGGLSTGTHSY